MIPLVDLTTQFRQIRQELLAAVTAALDSGRYALGPEVEAFEREFAAYCGAAHAIGVNSGTSALHLSLLAAGIGRGDEVITVPYTFVATIAAITYTGARPVFVDIDPASFTMDVARIEAAITDRTRAILPVHLFGQPADLDPILTMASRHGLAVIEDACQAHGARYRNRPVGALGDLGCFSFYPTKNLGACGEGGIVVTNDPERARVVRALRDWGQVEKYVHTLRGFNYRLDGVQGAVLRVKLRHLEAWIDARRAVARRYDAALQSCRLQTPLEMPYARHVYHIYAVRIAERDAARDALQAAGIQTGIHYPVPGHLQPAYADLGGRSGDYPEAERLARETLSLPIYPELSEEAQDQVIEALCHVAGRRS